MLATVLCTTTLQSNISLLQAFSHHREDRIDAITDEHRECNRDCEHSKGEEAHEHHEWMHVRPDSGVDAEDEKLHHLGERVWWRRVQRHDPRPCTTARQHDTRGSDMAASGGNGDRLPDVLRKQ